MNFYPHLLKHPNMNSCSLGGESRNVFEVEWLCEQKFYYRIITCVYPRDKVEQGPVQYGLPGCYCICSSQKAGEADRAGICVGMWQKRKPRLRESHKTMQLRRSILGTCDPKSNLFLSHNPTASYKRELYKALVLELYRSSKSGFQNEIID